MWQIDMSAKVIVFLCRRRARLHAPATRFYLDRASVVIAIIALLMAVLMPALQQVKRQARGVACLHRLKQWGLFFALYAEDYSGRFMQDHTALPRENRWVSALGNYYKWDDELTCCPNATKPWVDENGVSNGAEGTAVGVTMAWGYMNKAHWARPMKGSYGVNGYCMDVQPGREPPEKPPGTGADRRWRAPHTCPCSWEPNVITAWWTRRTVLPSMTAKGGRKAARGVWCAIA